LLHELLLGNEDDVIASRMASALDMASLLARMSFLHQWFLEEIGGVRDGETGYYVIAKHKLQSLHKDAFSCFIEEGFLIYQLIIKLQDRLQKNLLDEMEMSAQDGITFNFYRENTGRIEIFKDARLERTYFTIPPLCWYISEKSREEVVWGVPRTDPSTKVQSFHDMKDDLIDEMEYRESLNYRWAL